MNKFLISLLAGAAGMIMLSGCGAGSSSSDSSTVTESTVVAADTAVADSIVPEPAPELTEEYVTEAFNAIPDHDLDASAEKYFSKAFYRDLKEAFAVPTNVPGGIGDEEFLYYFISGQDDCADDYGVKSVKITSENTADVRFKCFDVITHKLTFALEDGRYVITDFDGVAAQVARYLKNAHRIFAGDGARKILADSGVPETDELYSFYLKEVKAYKSAYGIK